MDHDNEFIAPTKITDFAGLRRRALDQLWMEPLATFTEPEITAFANLFRDACIEFKDSPTYNGPTSCVDNTRDYRANPGLNIIERDFDCPAPIPKWVMLHSWLAPESAALHCPKTVATIARLMLSNRLTQYKSPVSLQ